jgi:membrane AbrB-like protein
MAVGNVPIIVPKSLFRLSHAVIGTLIAKTLPLSILGELGRDWPIFALGSAAVIGASSALGWVLARWQTLPGTTAVWGAAPGAATAMVLMAGNYGADARLVAFMQYLRVVTVVVVATVVSRFWLGQTVRIPDDIVWLPPVHAQALSGTLLLIIGSALLGHRFRIPAGPLLMPVILGPVLQYLGLIVIELPFWLLTPTYAIIGWQVGSRFDRCILSHAAWAFPRLLAATAGLLGVCAGFAALLVAWAGIDPLTAYLATSPGGIDAMAIIGTADHADMPFVMSMQTVRFLIVLLIGPWLARLVATSAARHALPAARDEVGTRTSA